MDAIERAFLDSIIAAPDDDAPRLIYADWLEERGDSERAEFIRVQCELGTYGEYRCPKYLGGMPDMLYGLPVVVEGESNCPCRWCGLKSREKALEFRTAFWGADFPFPAIPKNGCCVWRRGFVEKVRLSSEDWLRHADDLVRVTPLREVELTTLPRNEWGTPQWSENAFLRMRIDETKYEAYFDGRGRHRITRQLPMGALHDDVLDALKESWPGIKFTLPPAPSFSTAATVLRRNNGTVFELTGADRDIQVGDFVVQDEHGRIVRGTGPSGAAGVALSRMDANNMVLVRLADDSTLQIHQNAEMATAFRRAMERIAEDTANANQD